MKKLFFVLNFFLFVGMSYAQQEKWTIKKTVQEVFIEDGDTITESYVDEFSIELSEAVAPISFFMNLPEDFLVDSNHPDLTKKENEGRYAGFVKTEKDVNFEELFKYYGTEIGSRAELEKALNNPLFSDLVKNIHKSDKSAVIMATTLFYDYQKIERTKNILNSQLNAPSHTKDENQEVYKIAFGENQTMVYVKKNIGKSKLFEVFFLEHSHIRYDGWKGIENIIPKGTWVFVTTNKDPYLWE